MKQKLDITLGSDPELMLMDIKTDQIVSAIPVLKTNKHNPIDLGDGVKAYADNVLMECSMNWAMTPSGFMDRLHQAFVKMQAHIGEAFMLYPLSSHLYAGLPPKPSDEMVRAWLEDKDGKTEVPPEEWQVGCSPEFDAYEDKQFKSSPFTSALRTGSFHIHVGNLNWHKDEEELLLTHKTKLLAVKLMDIYVGLTSVAISWDATAKARRDLYGKAGRFRPTRYGIEYRVCDNYALRSPVSTRLLLDLTLFAMDSLAKDGESCIDMMEMDLVQNAINNQDGNQALAILGEAWIPQHLLKRILDVRRSAYQPQDMLLNWGI